MYSLLRCSCIMNSAERWRILCSLSKVGTSRFELEHTNTGTYKLFVLCSVGVIARARVSVSYQDWKQTKLSVSERSFSFAQILFAHPLVSSQVSSSSSLTLFVIVKPHNSCTSRGMASDPAVLTERSYVTAT